MVLVISRFSRKLSPSSPHKIDLIMKNWFFIFAWGSVSKYLLVIR